MKTTDKEEAAVRLMEQWAADSSHGYDQQYRWGERGDYDCSAAVISAWESVGVPVKSSGASYTGNMRGVFMRCGFRDVTKDVDLNTGRGLVRGDVLLNEQHHTAMYCGNGSEVEASINENGTVTGGQPGDQTGREFLVRPYRNYPWDCVLRYEQEKEAALAINCTGELPMLRRGNAGSAVAAMQGGLWYSGCDLGADGIDGDFGRETEKAVMRFQLQNGLEEDGICGKETWGRLMKGQRKNA